MPRVRCFFEVTVGPTPAGKIEFELFDDIVPKTAENFRSLCVGDSGNGITTRRPLHYKGCPFHRVIPNFMIQGGDFSNRDGTGGESIYGGKFKDENFKTRHDTAGLLSMANAGPNTNGSQFFITCKPTPHLDGKHVVFGKVVSGLEVVRKIEGMPRDARDKPKFEVVIADCGEIKTTSKDQAKEPKAEKAKAKKKSRSRSRSRSSSRSSSGSSRSSSSSSDSRAKKKAKKKEKKRLKKEKKRLKKEKKKEEKERKRRGGASDKAAGKDDKDRSKSPPRRSLSPSRSPTPEKRGVTGRIHKGRGSRRFRTPTPEGHPSRRRDGGWRRDSDRGYGGGNYRNSIRDRRDFGGRDRFDRRDRGGRRGDWRKSSPSWRDRNNRDRDDHDRRRRSPSPADAERKNNERSDRGEDRGRSPDRGDKKAPSRSRSRSRSADSGKGRFRREKSSSDSE